jgi:aspartate-semialdehyde dehydrogenase
VINLEFENPYDLTELISLLKTAPGVVVFDDPSKKFYPMPLIVDGKDDIYVGRIRRDESIKNGLNMFVVGDNIRKGAATNAIQILELFIK